MRYSEIFNVQADVLEAKGVFDADMDSDSQLHIDPSLFKNSTIPEFVGAYDEFNGYFTKVFIGLVPELRCDTKQVPRQNTQDQLITYDMNIVLGNVVFNQYGCYTVTMKYLNKDFYLKFHVQKTG